MSELFKFQIPGKPDYVQMVRLAIASIAGKADFDVDAVEDIKVAVAEACKIISCHGFDGFSECYDIICEITEEKLTIRIDDAGHGHDLIKGSKPCEKCPDDGDMALIVMESLMDKVEVKMGKTKIDGIKMVKLHDQRGIV